MLLLILAVNQDNKENLLRCGYIYMHAHRDIKGELEDTSTYSANLNLIMCKVGANVNKKHAT